VSQALTVSPLYVDPATGSDTAGGGTLSRPFATIQRAMGSCGNCTAARAECLSCTITLAPGLHRPGSLSVGWSVDLVGTGDVYGSNPSILEGSGEERFLLTGGELRQVKLTGYKNGLEASSTWIPGSENQAFPWVTDVWLTGGDYGISECNQLRVRTSSAPVRISSNRIAGIKCASLDIGGSATWPVEVTHNGDGSEEAGGVVATGHVVARYLVASHNQGPGVKASSVFLRDSTVRQNEGPGVWAYYTGTGEPAFATVPDLGTVASPGNNTLQDNAINFRVDSYVEKPASAVGNCWNPPAGEDYADAVADGDCGRIRKPFSYGDTLYIDAQGLTQGSFNWSPPQRFNYFLASRFGRMPHIQF
jgi:hypothetical protein